MYTHPIVAIYTLQIALSMHTVDITIANTLYIGKLENTVMLKTVLHTYSESYKLVIKINA